MKKNPVVLLSGALVLVSLYAICLTPFAAKQIRRDVLAWAAAQPDIVIAKAYTGADLSELSRKITDTNALRGVK